MQHHNNHDSFDLRQAGWDCKQMKKRVDKKFKFFTELILFYKPGPSFVSIILSQANWFFDQVLASETMTAQEKVYLLEEVQKWRKDM